MKWKMLFVGSFDKSNQLADFFVFLKMVTEAFHRFEKREKLLHDEEKNRFSRNFCKIIVISNGV